MIRDDYNTKNGLIVKWKDPETGEAKYEWDEDKKHGSHYHKLKNVNTRIADENGETHIQPGTEVEEDE